MHTDSIQRQILIACGGTGGHLFPGLRVAEVLRDWGHAVTLLISPKDIDQCAVRPAQAMGLGLEVLPAVGLERGQLNRFLSGFFQSWRVSNRLFQRLRPDAVLAMGGFTCAPPALAARLRGASVFLHEANSIPGRANRWLAPWADEAFAYFPDTVPRLRCAQVRLTGMPVRAQFQPLDSAASRIMLGLDPRRPALVVTGGSQGAHGLNELVLSLLPRLQAAHPNLQCLHLAGTADADAVRRRYAELSISSIVKPFLTEMELALNSATVVISRAGASSIAELAALRRPSVLIPFPAAADQHQLHNARALEATSAALVVEQDGAAQSQLFSCADRLLREEALRQELAHNLARWHHPNAAELIAARMVPAPRPNPGTEPSGGGGEADPDFAPLPGLRARRQKLAKLPL
jgi:UDP-N-acetylglucosamine--N-acetylmuramyl-(pentapeptide) pyrophosphoryl-undecaprenol N-acetylglucosamine transferase